MHIITSPDMSHRPEFEIDNGQRVPAVELPERAVAIAAAIKEKLPGAQWRTVVQPDIENVVAVHSKSYISYLCQACDSLKAAKTPATALYPSVFPYGKSANKEGVKGRHGQFCFDTYTPLYAATFDAALFAASAASEAARIISDGKSTLSYALCRPPGHHAEYDRCGGYCYFGNSAIAAHCLTKLGKVAVLDIDAHHGNGTQHLFYERDDVFTVSIHGDPDYLYPYFSGYVTETGSGRGSGFNRNFPLALGCREEEYQHVLESALDTISKWHPDFLIIALGVDTHEADPIGQFKLSMPYFGTIAATIRQLDLPVVVVQEGGYNLNLVGESVATFLLGMDGSD